MECSKGQAKMTKFAETDYVVLDQACKKRVILVAYNDERRILREAESMRLRKFKKPYDVKNYDKEKKAKQDYLDSKIIRYEEKDFFKLAEIGMYEGGTFESILTEAEIGLCVYRIITSIQLKKSAMNCFKRLPVNIDPPLNDETLIFYLLKYLYISEVVPLHSRSRNKENYKPLFDTVMKSYNAPVEDYRFYYGESIAIYFEWCNFMAKWLLYPAIIAILIYAHEKLFGLTSDSDWYNSVFSFGISIWAPLLVIYWRRRCAELDVEWDNYNLQLSSTSLRQQFKGELRTNPYTDQEEYHYSSRQRTVRYIESFVISTPFILAALFVMLSSLNMMGYSDKTDFFYMGFFASLSETGAIFEKGSTMAFIPSIFMTAGMMVIGKFYEPAAEYATDRENHQTMEGHRNSLNMKKFIFNFIFYFSHLFYVAFERKDLPGLRKELITLAIADEIRRIISESAAPTILRQGFNITKKFKSIVEEELDELTLPEYTYFEDYLELVIQYGYVTMFSAAFPLGAFINYLFLFFERRSDTFKIEKLCRRPLHLNTSDIGIWDEIMQILSYISVFTNLFLFAFASKHASTISAMEGGCINYYYFISIEHLLIIVVFLMLKLVSNQPKWVSIFLKRVENQEKKRVILSNALNKIKGAVSKIKSMNMFKI